MNFIFAGTFQLSGLFMPESNNSHSPRPNTGRVGGTTNSSTNRPRANTSFNTGRAPRGGAGALFGFIGGGLVASEAGAESSLAAGRDALFDRVFGGNQAGRESFFEGMGRVTRNTSMAAVAGTMLGLALPQTRARTMSALVTGGSTAFRGAASATNAMYNFSVRRPVLSGGLSTMAFTQVGFEREAAAFTRGFAPVSDETRERIVNARPSALAAAGAGMLAFGTVLGRTPMSAAARGAVGFSMGVAATSDAGFEGTFAGIRDRGMDALTNSTQTGRETRAEQAGTYARLGLIGGAAATMVGLALPMTRSRTMQGLAAAGAGTMRGAQAIGGAGLRAGRAAPLTTGLLGSMAFSDIGIEREANAFRNGLIPESARNAIHDSAMGALHRGLDLIAPSTRVRSVSDAANVRVPSPSETMHSASNPPSTGNTQHNNPATRTRSVTAHPYFCHTNE